MNGSKLKLKRNNYKNKEKDGSNSKRRENRWWEDGKKMNIGS